MLHFFKRTVAQPRYRFLPAILFMLFAAGLSGQQQQQQQPPQQQAPAQQAAPQQPADTTMSAAEIIDILQANPELLADAKSEIVAKLRDRGYAVTEGDVTDERLYSQIQQDDRVRQAVSDELKRRGYGGEQPEQPEETTTPANTQQQPSAQQPGAGRGQPIVGKDRAAGEYGVNEKGVQKNDGRRFYPYRNLPALQDLYTQAIVDPAKLERFGAALFRNSTVSDKTSMDIPAGSDYVLGPGDDLVIEYWGNSAQRLQVTVDREGRLLLPEAGSLLVAGHTLGETTDMVRKALSRQFRGISVDVSLGRLRTVRVYVVGDVKKPGAYDISALSSALSALLMAGGPTDTGSLRTVRHMRGKKLVEEVDLYELMLKGVSSGEQRIESGDSILVPPIGPQVTVAGMVRRPAIYELLNEQTLDQALDLAGGVPVSGELGNIKVERIQAHERKVMLSLNLPKNGDAQALQADLKKFSIKDGDRVTITPILPYSNQTIYLQGHVFRPGKYPYHDGIKVTDVVGSFQDLLPEPADHAEIVRLRPPDLRPSVIGFNLREVLDKKAEAPALQPFDTVRIFGRYEADAPKVSIYGEVLRPGEYPLSEHMTATDLLRMAGGFRRSAYTETADLASYSVIDGSRVDLEHRKVPMGRALGGEQDTDVLLKPGDVLTISQLGGWQNIGGAVIVNGEVLHPGRYGIEEGEKLSSVIKRAGGFLPTAYPYGAVLEREQVREISSRSRDDLVRQLQLQGIQGDGTGRPEPVALQRQRQALIDKIKQIQPNGRLLIHISPDIQKWENTPVDVEIRPGDTLLIPKRPNFVLVGGQVFNPTAITYAPGRKASWYLKQAGGPTGLANKKEVFVVRANGTVVGRTSSDWWSGSVLGTTLQPGDTVYVPEKISSSDRMKLFAESAQVLSGLAVAARVAISF